MHEDKIRTMLRSLLPSTQRLRARQGKKYEQRRRRRGANKCLRGLGYTRNGDDDSTMADLARLDRRFKSKLWEVVGNRRSSDKTGSFVRWAEAVTAEHTNVRDKYSHFVSHIGGKGSVIGDHAVGHFITPSFDFKHDEYRPRRSSKVRRPIPKEALREKLLAAIEDGKTDRLNEFLRSAAVTPGRCRKGAPCHAEDAKETTFHSLWIVGPDGTRERAHGQARAEEGASTLAVFPPGVLGYVESGRVVRTHDSSRCNNVVQIGGDGSVDRVLRVLYRWPRRRGVLSALLELIGGT